MTDTRSLFVNPSFTDIYSYVNLNRHTLNFTSSPLNFDITLNILDVGYHEHLESDFMDKKDPLQRPQSNSLSKFSANELKKSYKRDYGNLNA